MKLLTKTTLYYITVSLFTFFISGVVIYQLVKRLEENNVKNELTDQMYRISHDLLHLGENFERAVFVTGGLVKIELAKPNDVRKIQFSDTLIFDNPEKKYTPYKCISFFHEYNQHVFKISIYKSTIQSDYLIEQIAITITLIVIVFLLAVYFLYRYFFGRIWSDFFSTIDKIHHFDISSPEKLDFTESMIIEFNQLNEVLNKMINKISSDFQGLKDFTGNLTHEMQTPLAIIRTKADLVLQDIASNENQMKLAGEIKNETIRLSKVIKALTLFTKLEHNQFPAKQNIDLKKLTHEKLELFEDFIEAKSINVNLEISGEPVVKMNPELADILFTNLVKNAVRHNIENGQLLIEMKPGSFLIRNTGQKLNFDPELLFERFSKASSNNDSLGIGLSLVKKICDYYSYKVRYLCSGEIHTIEIQFN